MGLRIAGAGLALLVAGGLVVAPTATAAPGPGPVSVAPSGSHLSDSPVFGPAVGPAGFATVGITTGQAVATAAAQASRTGTTEFISVVSRSSGAVVAQTGNAGSQVGSESIYKLFLATYYLLIYGGYASTPDSVKSELSYMLRYSDDPTANRLFTANAVPTVAARYGLGATINSTDRIGHWGATRITARDMTSFLFQAGRDPKIGPWLLPVMAQVAPTGSDGFNQRFGLNALSGTHGSKQGWGCDSYFTAPSCAIHSVGYTGSYFVAVLQLAPDSGYPDPMRANATYAATTIAGSGPTSAPPPPPAPRPPPPPPLRDGDFIRDPGGTTYRLVGGAPIYVSNWANVGGRKPVRQVTAAQFARFRSQPADGTFIQAGLTTYRIAGGAPTYVSNWASVGGPHRVTVVDPVAVNHSGGGGAYRHLGFRPVDGTFVQAGRSTYRIAGGAPVYLTNWATVGGPHPVTVLDPVAINHSGAGGVYSHLGFRPVDGTFVQAGPYTYRIAGGAPLFVPTWSIYGGAQRVTVLDPIAINHSGAGGVYSHLGFRPTDGTQLRALPTGTQYVVRGGVARSAGVAHPTYVDQQTITRAGTGGVWNHLARG